MTKNHDLYNVALKDRELFPVIATGPAGTGKTFGAVERAVGWLQDCRKKVLVTRPNVSFAKEWAMKAQVNLILVPAKWDKYGKSAGYRRNAEMLTFEPDRVVAFPGGKGTDMMVDLSLKDGVFVQDLRKF